MSRLCKCGKYEVGSNDFVEDDSSTGQFCSHYCRRYYTEGMSKVLASDSKHHSNTWVLPKLIHDCDYCGTEMEVSFTKSTKNGSGRFCSRDCFYTMLSSRRKVKPRWGILRSLQQRGPMSAKELAYTLNKWETNTNVRGVAMLLRPYVLKGICNRDEQGQYILVDDRPVGWLAANE
jgi:hypothetical protein|tara:strand:- start:526 stop:1053 length:528 start_codon:yes stop_codon:yes gene_type:complete